MKSNILTKSSIVSSLRLLVFVLLDCVPVIGVLFYGWSLLAILFLYWGENVVTGVFNALKMIAVDKKALREDIPFFSLHYGMFSFVHLVFIIILFGFVAVDALGAESVLAIVKNVSIGITFVVINQGTAYKLKFLQSDLGQVKVHHLFFEPYKQVIVLHLTLFLGAFYIISTGASKFAVVILASVKIFFDTVYYIRE